MTKISSFTTILSAAVDAINDFIPIVDISETGSARNKKISPAELKEVVAPGVLAELDSLALDDISDVNLTGLADNHVLVYDLASTSWKPEAPSGGGGTVRVEDEGGTIVASASGINFAGAGVAVTDAGGGEALVTISGGGSGGTWQLVGTDAGHAATGKWTQSTDGSAANVNFTGLSGLTELLVVFRNVTLSVSGGPSIQLSTDNGSTYYSTSGDYIVVADTGIETATTLASLTSASATAARSGIGVVRGINLSGTPKMIDRTNRDSGGSVLFVGSTDDVDALRCLPSAGGNFTGGEIFLFGR